MKKRASNLILISAGNKATRYTLLNEAWPWHNEVGLAEDRRFQILLHMSETHFETWHLLQSDAAHRSCHGFQISSELNSFQRKPEVKFQGKKYAQ